MNTIIKSNQRDNPTEKKDFKELANYTRELGSKICEKYLQTNPTLKKHSENVAYICYSIAQKIIEKNPEFRSSIIPEFLGFLGYVHNIGTFIKRERHELHTIYLLTEKENIPQEIALKTRHGQLVEDYINDGDNYYPLGLEGIILTYADIIADEGEAPSEGISKGDCLNGIVSLETRTEKIIHLMQQKQSVFKDYDSSMIENFKKAIPRYLRYEKIIKSFL